MQKKKNAPYRRIALSAGGMVFECTQKAHIFNLWGEKKASMEKGDASRWLCAHPSMGMASANAIETSPQEIIDWIDQRQTLYQILSDSERKEVEVKLWQELNLLR